MTKELREKMAALRAIAPQLNAEADKANALVREADEQLRDVGISARVGPYDSEYTGQKPDDENEDEDEDESPCVYSYLAFGRFAGGYCIHAVYETTVPTRDEYNFEVDKVLDVTKVAWSALPREERLMAIALLPALLDRLTAKANEQVEKSKKSTAASPEATDPADDVPAPKRKAKAKRKATGGES